MRSRNEKRLEDPSPRASSEPRRDLPAATREFLAAVDWEKMKACLAAHAHVRVWAYRWRYGTALPKGNTPEDIAGGVIEKVLSGTRKWRPDKHPDLQVFLESAIDSDVYHLLYSSDHRRVRRLRDVADLNEVTWLPKQPTTPEEAVLQKERDHLVKQQLSAAVSGEPDLARLLDAVRRGCATPASVAVLLGVPVHTVYRWQRKLIRRLQSQRSISTENTNEQDC